MASSADKMLNSLPGNISTRIMKKLDLIALEPFRYIESFVGDYYKIRIGEYRLLCDIDAEKRVISVQIFDKRERIY
ncbi:Uncharacterised protein [uncultured archaeon]|nr:Uncharacterised protein [uncultured archaeon]